MKLEDIKHFDKDSLLKYLAYLQMKKVVNCDVWAKANKDKFAFYAKTPTDDYSIASIMVTFNMCASKILSDDYKTDIPVVWMRDVIEHPMKVFDYGEYSYAELQYILRFKKYLKLKSI